MNKHQTLIGITGGIGAGKSFISRICRILGYPVYDCDSRAKYLMDNSSRIKKFISEEISAKAITPKGEINRKELAKVIFSDNDARIRLNKAVHSMVRQDISEWVSSNSTQSILFVETAIPNTSNITPILDVMWLVSAQIEERLKRVRQRDDHDESHIMARMKAQMNEFSYFSIPVRMIDNSDNTPLIQQIESNINEIKKLYTLC